jgi:hypothetical protein
LSKELKIAKKIKVSIRKCSNHKKQLRYFFNA